MVFVLSEADGPLLSAPTRAEVPAGVFGTIQPRPRLFTSPTMGKAGRGPSVSGLHI
jgi:hypothetical protein